MLTRGTRVRIKDVETTTTAIKGSVIAPGREGKVSSAHTNGVICVVMDNQEQLGSWTFSESELEFVK